MNHWSFLPLKLTSELIYVQESSSHDADLVSNLKSVLVAGEGNVGLLFSSRSVKSVDLLNLDFVKLLTGLLDHLLVGFLVDDKNEGVAVLNGLDSRFRAQWVLDHGESVEGIELFHSFQYSDWVSLLSKSLWSSEGGLSPNFSLNCGMSSLLHSS